MSIETTGKINFKVGTETYQTWYMIIGDIKNSKHRPLVALHGGPGMSHQYMLPHKALYEENGIPIVLYDQIGIGESSHCPDLPKEFWTPEMFMDELDNLMKALQIYDDFDLLGHSWGGMLAAQYAATHTPLGLKRLILANTSASAELIQEATEKLLEGFGDDFAKMVHKHEADGKTDAEEYQAASAEFSSKHVCTIDPWPKELMDSFTSLQQDPTVYYAMMGPLEFRIVGSMKTWSITDIVHKIPYPTLLLSSPKDKMQECCFLPFFVNIPKIKWVELQNSSHLGMLEEPERYFEVILDFLAIAEGTDRATS